MKNRCFLKKLFYTLSLFMGAHLLVVPSMSAEENKKPNRLIHEQSPYLLQHAYNPVDWFPWGEEAFKKARQENKPILLSIGYSTCHWCHVMEKESFENPEIAAIMNKYVVSIKLDREERPDIDKIYMTAVQAMTGSGGWPLNVFLTHDLKPFMGGTYFPPESRWGRPGWPTIVQRIGESWQNPVHRQEMLVAGDRLFQSIERYLAQPNTEASYSEELLKKGYESYQASYDPAEGGFAHAPKFPMPVNQNFLFRFYAFSKNNKSSEKFAEKSREMALITLKKMAQGGIYDWIGGGFSRYSTDGRWHIPHFEKMLYDNAQLAVNYLEAYQISGDKNYLEIADETLNYVIRDMTHPQGGFYSAEDADSFPWKGADHKIEGAFYVWEYEEIIKLLGEKEGALLGHFLGVEKGGNAQEDPHGEFQNKNILYQAHTKEETAKKFKLSVAEVEQVLQNCRKKLFEARQQRPRPHLDDKILTAWNGLMISAFSKGFQITEKENFLEAAQKSALFIRKNLYDKKSKHLYRRWRKGERKVLGMADDYAFLIQGVIDLYEASFNVEWLEWAFQLQEEMMGNFYDSENGGFFMTKKGHDGNVALRVREEADNVEPSASSVGVSNLFRLSQFFNNKKFQKAADKTLKAFSKDMENNPRSQAQMLSSLVSALQKPRQIIIAGDLKSSRAMLERIHQQFIPNKAVILLAGDKHQEKLNKHLPFLKEMKPLSGKPTAYVCVDYSCQLPTNDLDQLLKQLNAL